MDVMRAIESRHSVRQFTDEPITGDALVRLQAAVDAANAEAGLHIQLVLDEPAAFTGLLAHYGKFRGVRNYIALVGHDTPDLDELCGYYGERIVLEAQDAGLVTCWVGGTFSKRKARYELADGERLCLVIAIGHGENPGRPHTSKAVSRLAKTGGGETPDWFERGMRAALLAPTAMNQQHFSVALGEDGVVRVRSTGGPFANVDLGIVEYHFEAASGHAVASPALTRIRS